MPIRLVAKIANPQGRSSSSSSSSSSSFSFFSRTRTSSRTHQPCLFVWQRRLRSSALENRSHVERSSSAGEGGGGTESKHPVAAPQASERRSCILAGAFDSAPPHPPAGNASRSDAAGSPTRCLSFLKRLRMTSFFDAIALGVRQRIVRGKKSTTFFRQTKRDPCKKAG